VATLTKAVQTLSLIYDDDNALYQDAYNLMNQAQAEAMNTSSKRPTKQIAARS
jgi:hypothetical protein